VCDLADGGAERLVLDLCRRSPADITADVATVHDGGALADSFVGVRSAGRVRGHLGVRALGRLARLARGYDVVHTHLWAGDAWGRPAAVLAGVPVISTAHNVDRDEPAWKGRVTALSARWTTRVCAVSEAVAAHVRDQGVPAARVVVVPNGVALERFRARWAGLSSRRALYVGRLVPQKGADVLVDAAWTVGEGEFTLAGDGPLRGRLRPPPNVALAGRVDDVPARLNAARVAVIPSRWEGFGLFAVEAMAAGTPVVASAVDGLAEVVGDAGLLVPPGDARALADAIKRVLHDDELALRLSIAGRQRAQAFSLDAMIARYAAIYRAC
jgi:glycosyltransferase involved in cell wall biosynthesis